MITLLFILVCSVGAVLLIKWRLASPDRYYESHYIQSFPIPMAKFSIPEGKLVSCNTAFANCFMFATAQDCIHSDQGHEYLPNLNIYLASLDKKNLAILTLKKHPTLICTESIHQQDGLFLDFDVEVIKVNEQVSIELVFREKPAVSAATFLEKIPLAVINVSKGWQIERQNNQAVLNFRKHNIGTPVDFLIYEPLRKRINLILSKRALLHQQFSVPVCVITNENILQKQVWHIVVNANKSFVITAIPDAAVDELRRLQVFGDQKDRSTIQWELDYHDRLQYFRGNGKFLGFSVNTSYAGWLKSIHPDDSKAFDMALHALKLQKLGYLDCTYRIALDSGLEVSIRSMAYIKQFDSDGKPISVAGIHVLLEGINDQLVPYKDKFIDPYPIDYEALVEQLSIINDLCAVLPNSPNAQDLTRHKQEIVEASRTISRAFQLDKLHNRGDRTSLEINVICNELDLIYRVEESNEILASVEMNIWRKIIYIISELAKQPDLNPTFEKVPPAAKIELRIDRCEQLVCSSCKTNTHVHMLCAQFKLEYYPTLMSHIDKLLSSSLKRYESIHGTVLSRLDFSGYIHQQRGHLSYEHDGNNLTIKLFFPVSKPVNQRTRPVIGLAPQSFNTYQNDANAKKEVSKYGYHRILLVDDEPVVLAFMERVLIDAGYEVESNVDSLAAYEEFAANPYYYGFLITDQEMPNLSGDILIEMIQQIRPELPIIICSGYSPNVKFPQGQQFKDNYDRVVRLRKPIDIENLLSTIEATKSAVLVV